MLIDHQRKLFTARNMWPLGNIDTGLMQSLEVDMRGLEHIDSDSLSEIIRGLERITISWLGCHWPRNTRFHFNTHQAF